MTVVPLGAVQATAGLVAIGASEVAEVVDGAVAV